MAESIFKDQALNNVLSEEGYVVVPFLNPHELSELKKASEQFISDDVNHFYATTHSPDLALRKQANQAIHKNINSATNSVFDKAELLGGAFITKPANGKGVLALHQDWNIVDETQFRSYNLWIPLVDTNAENGAVHVLPKSHDKEHTIRGPRIPFQWNNLEETIYAKMTRLDMKAGDALVYDHALWHSSPPNMTTENRPAVVVGMTQKGTPLKAWFGNGDSVEEYELNASYFFDEIDITRPTSLKKIKTFDFKNQAMTEERWKTIYLGEPIKKWWQTLFS